jgi:hypothetical protein
LVVATVLVELELSRRFVDRGKDLGTGQFRLVDGNLFLIDADDVPLRMGQGLFLDGENFDLYNFEDFFGLGLLFLFHEAEPPWLHKKHITSGHCLAICYTFYVYFTLALLANRCILKWEVPMNPKRTMTLNLTDQEMVVLEELSVQKDLSKTALLRQALRLYQLVDARISRGEKLFFEDSEKQKAELMVL